MYRMKISKKTNFLEEHIECENMEDYSFSRFCCCLVPSLANAWTLFTRVQRIQQCRNRYYP